MLQKAGNAKNTVNDSELEEKIRLAYQDYYLGQYSNPGYSFQDALEAIFGENMASVSELTNGVYTVSVNGKTYEFNPSTNSMQPIATVPWTKNADGSYSTGEGANKVTIHVGDYVNYDPTSGATEAQMTYTSYSASSATSNPTRNNGRTSGYSSDQSFDARTYKNAGYRWRVLDVKNGTIRLISEEYVGPGTYSDIGRTTYYLNGEKGYINGIEELNAISGIFGHGRGAQGAKSMTIKDINDITGYNPDTATPKSNAGAWNEYGNTVTYTYNSENNYTATRTNGANAADNTFDFSVWDNTFKYYDSTAKKFRNLTSGSKQIQCTYYNYYPALVNSNFLISQADENGRINVNETFKTLFGVATVGNDGRYRTFTRGNECLYWLASDYTDADQGPLRYGIFCIENSVVNSGYGGSLASNSGEWERNFGVRPIVTLRPDVQLEQTVSGSYNIILGE